MRALPIWLLGLLGALVASGQQPLRFGVADEEWRLGDAAPSATGFALVGTATDSSGTHLLALVADTDGQVRWQQRLARQGPPSWGEALTLSPEGDWVVGGSLDGNALVTKLAAEDGQMAWVKTFGRGVVRDLASAAGDLLALVENEGETRLLKLDSEGILRWETPLADSAPTTRPGRVVGLPDGSGAVASGGNLWGIGPEGRVAWHLGGARRQVRWYALRRLRNGELVAVGEEQPPSLGQDAQAEVAVVASDGSRMRWAKTFGEAGDADAACDALETADGKLWLLCSRNEGFWLAELSAKHEVRTQAILGGNPGISTKNAAFLLKSNNRHGRGTTWIAGTGEGDKKAGWVVLPLLPTLSRVPERKP